MVKICCVYKEKYHQKEQKRGQPSYLKKCIIHNKMCVLRQN